jgi:hypothetical protein
VIRMANDSDYGLGGCMDPGYQQSHPRGESSPHRTHVGQHLSHDAAAHAFRRV